MRLQTRYVVYLTDTTFTFLVIERSLFPSPPTLFFILCYFCVKETISPLESHTFWTWWSRPGGATPPAPDDWSSALEETNLLKKGENNHEFVLMFLIPILR